MKNSFFAPLILLSLGQAHAQVPPVVVVKPTVVEVQPAVEIVPGSVEVIPAESGGSVVVETVEAPGVRRIDRADARKRFAIAPRPLPAPPVIPGARVETTETTTTIETPGQPTRIYKSEENVVVVDGQELPYLTVPVLFVKETAELLDSESRVAIEDTAAVIMETLTSTPAALFDVEGHTSTDGLDDFNLQLSVDRARRIHMELTKTYGVPATALTAHGYGENYPIYPNATEEQMMLDRRVLVVRKR